MHPITKDTKNNTAGGHRPNSGRKTKDVTKISITVPAAQKTAVDALPGTRSEHYAKAMEMYLHK